MIRTEVINNWIITGMTEIVREFTEIMAGMAEVMIRMTEIIGKTEILTEITEIMPVMAEKITVMAEILRTDRTKILTVMNERKKNWKNDWTIEVTENDWND